MTIHFGDSTSQTTAASGGKILQVVNTFKDDRVSTQSTSFVDVGLSASITPSDSSHKILIMWNCNVSKSSGVGHFNLMRDSTNIAQPEAGAHNQLSTKQFYHAGHSAHTNVSHQFLDSPSSTSSITYKLQFRNEASDTMAVNGWTSGSHYRSVSGMTLIEVD